MDIVQAPPPPRAPRRPEQPQNQPFQEHDGHQPNAESVSSHGEADWGEVRKPNKAATVLIAIVGAIALAALFATGFLPRHQQQKELAADANAALNGPVPVNVVAPVRAPETIDIDVPGTMRPWQEVSIFARTTGYLKRWYPDISNQVKAGQLMAEIDSPEIDQQLSQANAAVLQMQAAVAKSQSDLQIAQVTFTRYQSLRNTNGVTQEDLDQKTADFNAAKANLEAARANVTAAEANVNRLKELQGFEKVFAPFSGVITGRGYDTGALINADPTVTDTKPLYKIAENDVLRVFVNVPQSSALSIVKGMDAQVVARERPGQNFIGKVMGTTNYLDPGSRSLLTEIKVPNDGGALLPGMYVEVHFHVNRIHPPLMVPGPAIISDAQGTRIAVVKDGKVRFASVSLGQDFGSTVEVTQGLEGDEKLIANPGERIVDGASVEEVNTAPANGSQPPPQKERVAEAAK